MVEPLFSYTAKNVNDVHLVFFQGELDVSTAEGLEDQLVEIAGSTVVIDLSGLTFTDSTGIGVMVRVKEQLGDDLVLTRPRPSVRRVFEITGLGDWFTDWDPAWAPSDPVSETSTTDRR